MKKIDEIKDKINGLKLILVGIWLTSDVNIYVRFIGYGMIVVGLFS